MKIKIDRIVIVEGRYDKIKLDSILDATVIAVNGFGLFKDKEKKQMLRALAAKKGAIILCDSDSGGTVIRGHLNSIIPKQDRINLYIPEVYGKEKRKETSSKEGKLGVEGIDAQLLRDIFKPFESNSEPFEIVPISVADLAVDGFSGGENSSKRRMALAKALGLPSAINSKLLVDAVNILGGKRIYDETVKKLKLNDH